ncbi:MAG TPA: hypothetical protein VHD37_03190 [Candidatus Paceibacterota bacterium]|nr:hypothetical protein [Candidatus Paceibacterota bacterium]
MITNPRSRFAAVALMLCMVVVLVAAPFGAPAQADPVSLIVTLVVAAGVAVVADYYMCGFNIFFYCDNGGGGGGGNFKDTDTLIVSSDGKATVAPAEGLPEGATCASPANICGLRSRGTVTNGVCSAAIPSEGSCCTSAQNACGQVNYARPSDSGSCSGITVSPPSNSSCPAPIIADKGFYADPSRVRSGNSAKLFWDVENATSCDLSGGSLVSQLGLAIKNALGLETGAIKEKTVFTITCQNGLGGPTTSKQATVNLVPSYQEI